MFRTRRVLAPSAGAALAILLTAASSCFGLDLGQPPLKASDGDGIPDDWKAHGVDIHWPDGRTHHIDLKKLGVRRGQKAVVVWVDWMESAGAGHSHRPVKSGDRRPTPFGATSSPRALENDPLDRVVQAFRGSGVDKNRGVRLALIWADKVTWPGKPFQPIPEKKELGENSAGEYDWTEFDNIRKARTGDFSQLFGHGFHYAAFIHGMKGNSATGLSKGIPGDEFLISLGALDDQVGSADDQSGTFMHELGHNLGLRHGGSDDVGYKPNYLSVMNYLFQRVGIANLGTFGHFDYSRVAIASLDESHLSAREGISALANLDTYGTAHGCLENPPDAPPPCSQGRSVGSPFSSYDLVWRLYCPVDWKCARADAQANPCPEPETVSAETFAADINGDGCAGILEGHDDWSNLYYGLPPRPEEGEPMRRKLLPAEELDSDLPTLFTEMRVEHIEVSATPDGVVIRWSRVPLQRVIGYEVLRLEPSGRTSIVWRTTKSEFVDKSATAGVRYVYSVRPVYAVSNAAEEQALLEEVKDARITRKTDAALLGKRAADLHLLPEGRQLYRGLSKKAAPVTAH